jgi:hypothetical protein
MAPGEVLSKKKRVPEETLSLIPLVAERVTDL